jgi:hypothetical protein
MHDTTEAFEASRLFGENPGELMKGRDKESS